MSQGRGWFLLGVLLVWAAAWVWAPDRIGPALALFASLLASVLPALGLVFLFLLLANLFSERPWVERHLGQESGWRGWLLSLGAGVLSAGPPLPWYALAGQLMGRGVRPGLAATFLYARAVKLPMLPLLIHYFGLAYTLVLTAWLLVLAVLTGLVMQRLMQVPRKSPP
jgi:uncharacterized membrane protein YraQ (UPF0718 family)